MKSIKTLAVSFALAASMLFSLNASAGAVLVTQELLVGGNVFGEVSIAIDSRDLNAGVILDTAFDGTPSFVNATFFNFFNTSEVFNFEAVIDTSNIFAGFEFLAFDVLDDDPSVPFIYQVIVDPFASLGFIDIFDFTTGDFFAFSDEVTLGQVTVNAPSMIALFSLMLAGLVFIRKKVK
jgi:hypothetical protein